MGSNKIGDAILSAIDALPEVDKTNRQKVMRAMGNAIEDNLTSATNLLPTEDNLYDIGSLTARWRDGYLGGSLYIEDKIGIGTITPGTSLQIAKGDASYILLGPNTTWGAYLQVGSGPSVVDTGKAQVISTNGNLHLDAATDKNIYISYYSARQVRVNSALRFTNQTNMKGLVWGNTNWGSYYSRIDDYNGQLYIMTDDNLYFSDIDTGTGAPGSVWGRIYNGNWNIGNGSAPSYKLHVRGDIYANGGWVRVSGQRGIYFQSYGGGWYMIDSTWVRAYNNKYIYTGGVIRAGSSLQAKGGTYYLGSDGMLKIRYSDSAPSASAAGRISCNAEPGLSVTNGSSWKHTWMVNNYT